jgi:hypothetical protein
VNVSEGTDGYLIRLESQAASRSMLKIQPLATLSSARNPNSRPLSFDSQTTRTLYYRHPKARFCRLSRMNLHSFLSYWESGDDNLLRV